MDNNYIILNLKDVDPDKTLRVIVNELLCRNKSADQQKLPTDDKPEEKTDSGKDRKYFCNNPSCKKEITKKEVAFCLHSDNRVRFGGKVYCRNCQENK